MGKTLYFDCFSGRVRRHDPRRAARRSACRSRRCASALGSLAIDHGMLSAERVLRAGISATKFRLIESRATRRWRSRPRLSRPTARAHARHGRRASRARPRRPRSSSIRLTIALARARRHHSLADIERLHRRSALSPPARERAVGAVPPARRGRGGDSPDAASIASTCTRSAPSTRSSTSSARCSRWSGSAPTASSRRR